MSEQETDKTDEQEQETPPYEVTTAAQVQRTYAVRAGDKDQAHARLRAFLKDPDALREGVVVELRDKQIDVTPQKVKSVEVPLAAKAKAKKQPDTVRGKQGVGVS